MTVMVKQSLLYLILSILVVIFAKYAHLLIVYIAMAYTYANVKLMPIFSSTAVGIMLRQVLTLVLIPVIIAAIPALSYRLIKGKSMPYFIEVTWLIWLVLVLCKVLIH